MIFVNRNNVQATMEKVKTKTKIHIWNFNGMFTDMGIAREKIFVDRIILLFIHCKQKFQNPLIAILLIRKSFQISLL